MRGMRVGYVCRVSVEGMHVLGIMLGIVQGMRVGYACRVY